MDNRGLADGTMFRHMPGVAVARPFFEFDSYDLRDDVAPFFNDDPVADTDVLSGEYAQLEAEFCAWKRSSPATCNTDQLNRSAFVAWIDCQL